MPVHVFLNQNVQIRACECDKGHGTLHGEVPKVGKVSVIPDVVPSSFRKRGIYVRKWRKACICRVIIQRLQKSFLPCSTTVPYSAEQSPFCCMLNTQLLVCVRACAFVWSHQPCNHLKHQLFLYFCQGGPTERQFYLDKLTR